MDVFLTDDGSSDGTSEMVKELFPKVKILKGDGNLFWAGGMRNSWREALKGRYDAYLLLNDDTTIYPETFKKIIKTKDFCIKEHGVEGIYVGATKDLITKEISYGGSTFTNRFLGTMQRVPINEDEPVSCELGNANIMWVPRTVVGKIGILSEGYVHGMADYDYTMKAVKSKIPVLVLPGISGECIDDHGDIYEGFVKSSFTERIKFLYNPVGLDFTSQLHHMKKHFPIRLPLFYLMGWFKVLFPKIYHEVIYGTRAKQS